MGSATAASVPEAIGESYDEVANARKRGALSVRESNYPDVQYPDPESNNLRIPVENRTSRKQAAQNPAQLPTKPAEPKTPTDPDLSRIVAAWPTLPEPIRRAVLALVGSAAG